MPVEVARTVRRALMGVVADGTARRLSGAYTAADGSQLPVGGKTGTGDNRFDRFGRGGGIISSRVVDRTATFVFVIDNRFFGSLTAFTHEPYAARYSYTSAMAVQLLKSIGPQLAPLIDQGRTNTNTAESGASDADARSTSPSVSTATWVSTASAQR